MAHPGAPGKLAHLGAGLSQNRMKAEENQPQINAEERRSDKDRVEINSAVRSAFLRVDLRLMLLFFTAPGRN
jgi:hypothetical protein